MSDDQRALYLCSIANNLGQVVDRFGDKTDPVLQAYVAAGKKYDIAAYIKASPPAHAFSARFRACSRTMISWSRRRSRGPRSPPISTARRASSRSTARRSARRSPPSPASSIPFNLTGHPALAVPPAGQPTACRRASRSSVRDTPTAASCGSGRYWNRLALGRIASPSSRLDRRRRPTSSAGRDQPEPRARRSRCIRYHPHGRTGTTKFRAEFCRSSRNSARIAFSARKARRP